MNPLLETDFAMQQQTLQWLREQRKNLPNGSEEADDSEVKIIAAANLILSYETLKYYELESRLGLQMEPEKPNRSFSPVTACLLKKIQPIVLDPERANGANRCRVPLTPER